MFNDLWEDDSEDSVDTNPWKCAACGIDNRPSRTDCRICMCPRYNSCVKCKRINEDKARYCRFCGAPTEFSYHRVFVDPAARKQAAKDARAMDRKYRSVGHYYQWEDGPYQAAEEFE